MNPAERKEITDSIKSEFQTFKDDVFKPMAESVKFNTDKTADQGEDIATNRTDIRANERQIKTVAGDVKENRTSIGRLFLWIIGVLVTILGTFAGIYLSGGIG